MRIGLLCSDAAIRPLQHGPYLFKRGWGSHHGDERCLLVETLAKAVEKNLDKLAVVDGVPKFMELVGDGLEALAVGANAGVALNGAVELCVEGVDASVKVVLKKLSKGRPKCGGVGGGAEDQIEYLGAHSLVDPLYDSEIILDPVRIRGTRGSVDVDVLKKVATFDMNFEEMTPVIVVVFGSI